MRVESPEALISAVLAGAGIGVLYEDTAITELRKGTLIKLNPVGMNLNGTIYFLFIEEMQNCHPRQSSSILFCESNAS